MRRRLAALAVLVSLAPACRGWAVETRPLLASAPVDAEVFRDGEVRRSAQPFGSWTLVCDTIARLGHKFCSLRSHPVQVGGAAVDLLVSTGDDGRPAALARLPFGLSLPFGLLVEPLGPVHATGRHISVAVCGGAGCEAVWTLSPGEIAALQTGAGLRVSMRAGQLSTGRRGASESLSATVPGGGFADAITASLR